MEPIIKCDMDPVYVEQTTVGKIDLRIGGYGVGEGRHAYLTPAECRQLAYALLLAAEKQTGGP